MRITRHLKCRDFVCYLKAIAGFRIIWRRSHPPLRFTPLLRACAIENLSEDVARALRPGATRTSGEPNLRSRTSFPIRLRHSPKQNYAVAGIGKWGGSRLEPDAVTL
jgi:hypothetical protein